MIGALLRLLDPERAHRLTIAALKAAPLPHAPADDPALAVEAFGLRFPNPLGMAAGFDKNAEVYNPLLRLGFGFAEIGTVTPLAQPGNPRPRIFRLEQDEAVINRLGFNGEGHAPALERLRREMPAGIVGVNIGANKDAADRVADYVAGIKAFAGVASYFTVNVSSPNTPGLRDLQGEAALDELLARVLEARDAAGTGKPVLLKIAPDLTLGGLDGVVRIARARKIDGMIVSNTTISRPASLMSRKLALEAGGLSGKPLFALSTAMLAAAFLRVEGQFPLVGAGGVGSAQAALAKIRAGATLLQLYSALVYRGPGLVREIKRGLAAAGPLAALTGVDAAEVALR